MPGIGLLAALAAALLLAAPARAGGLYTGEFATTSQANAGAGRGAWAPDASAALTNPATMTRLGDHAFAGGLAPLYADIRFDPSSSTPSGGGSGGDQSGFAALASFNYVHRISDRVRFGLSFFSLSGSALDPDDDWAGRFQMTKISLLTVSLAPSLAVRVTDWLSVGGGPVITYGVLDWNLMVSLPGGGETKLKLDDLDDWEPAGRVGLLLEPIPDLALSVYYLSETDFELKGKIKGPVGLEPDLDTELPLAQTVEVNAYWQATERLALMAIFDWEDWSAADQLSVTLSDRSIEATTGFRDTYKVGVGANYRLGESWLLQTGITYDTSPFKDKKRTVALPIDEQIRFAFGAQYDWSESTRLGLSFTYVNLGQGKVRQQTVRGDYEDNNLFIFGLTVSFDSLPWGGRLTFGEPSGA